MEDDIGANDTVPKGPADRRGDWRRASNGKWPLANKEPCSVPSASTAQPRSESTTVNAEWLRTFRWDYWVTGTSTDPLTPATWLHLVKHWLARFPQSYAAVGLAEGPLSQTIHSHILVGGIGHANRAETLLRGSWIKHGHLLIEHFSPALGGVEYLCRQPEEIEIIGSPLLYKPRHLRGHRGRNRRTVKDLVDTTENHSRRMR